MESKEKERIQQNCHIIKIPRYGELIDEWHELHELLTDYVACLSGEIYGIRLTDMPDHVVIYFPKDINADGMYRQIQEEPNSALLKENARILFQKIFQKGEVLTSFPETNA